ncbi:unnamed protein product [Ixodes hexagonus]
MFYDDGESFLGVHALSRELAFLIGATRDNGTYTGCARKNRYLTGLLDDTTSFRLSHCAENAISMFFQSNRAYNCWNDTPKAIVPNNWTLPSSYLEKSLTSGRLDLCRSKLFYLDVERCRNYSTAQRSRSCRVSCCVEGFEEPSELVMEPDGRVCGWRGHKMCIHGDCLEFS